MNWWNVTTLYACGHILQHTGPDHALLLRVQSIRFGPGLGGPHMGVCAGQFR
jgi:hypothetical protein